MQQPCRAAWHVLGQPSGGAGVFPAGDSIRPRIRSAGWLPLFRSASTIVGELSSPAQRTSIACDSKQYITQHATVAGSRFQYLLSGLQIQLPHAAHDHRQIAQIHHPPELQTADPRPLCPRWHQDPANAAARPRGFVCPPGWPRCEKAVAHVAHAARKKMPVHSCTEGGKWSGHQRRLQGDEWQAGQSIWPGQMDYPAVHRKGTRCEHVPV